MRFVSLLCFAFLSACSASPAFAADPLSTVKVCKEKTCKGGHGSAVHIGNGFLLTARHVAEISQTFVLKTSDGKFINAESLWLYEQADIAVLRITDEKYTLPKSSLDCRPPVVGERFTAVGNPADIEFAQIEGYVSTGAQTLGNKKDVYVGVLPIFGGLSGGPVLDKDGEIIALMVAMLSNSSYALLEPIEKVCALLPDLNAPRVVAGARAK